MEKRISFRLIYLIIFTLSLFVLLLNTNEAKSLFPGDEQYVLSADKMPEPIGGMGAIMKKITAKPDKEGKVYLMVYVNENGNVDDVKVVKGLGSKCDEDAIKAIKSSKFSPAMNGSSSVKAKLSMAIKF
jgi:periplasmic protein TonB